MSTYTRCDCRTRLSLPCRARVRHSDRVAGAGCFGAALMMHPELVARCMAAMGEALQRVADEQHNKQQQQQQQQQQIPQGQTQGAGGSVEGAGGAAGAAGAGAERARAIPLTVKCRLGVDEVDSYEQLVRFVRVVSEGSHVRHFVVHSRKAFLNVSWGRGRMGGGRRAM